MNKIISLAYQLSGIIKGKGDIKACSLMVFLFVLVGASSGQTPYTANGTYTVPAGVTQIKVECWGAGGGGGAATGNPAAGGGGAGGAYTTKILTVVPGNTYTVTVGAGGLGAAGAGAAGNPSWFNTVGTVFAEGGVGGALANTDNSNGAGGIASALLSIGDLVYQGGNGALGIFTDGTVGGAGGGGAGSTGAGNNSITGTGGAAKVNNGGAGANGVANSTIGAAGLIYGGGGSGGKANTGAKRNGGSGAAGYVIITLPANILLSSPTQVAVANVYQGSTKQPLFSFSTAISTSNALINSVTFNTTGSYSATDVSKFQLWYKTTNDFATATQIGSDITTALGTGSHSFTGLTQVTNQGATGYFWITTDYTNTATSGATISVNAFTVINLTYENATITGSTSVGGTQTIQPVAVVVLASSNPSVAAANLLQSSINLPIYSFSAVVTKANATLNAVSFTTAGYVMGDVVKFKLWYSTSNTFSTASQVGSEILSSVGPGPHTFSGFTQSTPINTTGYFWITVDVADFPINNNILTVNALTTANLTYALAFTSGMAYANGTQTFQRQTGILISSTQPAVWANDILQSTTKQVVYKLKMVLSATAATLNAITFTSTGSYVSGDLVNFKIWYNNSNNLVGATLLGTITTTLGTGSHTLGSLSQAMASGSIDYLWVTVDLSATAVITRTVAINSISPADLSFSSGTPYGSLYAGGTQTIQKFIDTDGDGVPDIYDLDDDNDGIPDINETTLSGELFPNSDFSAGNTGFATSYICPPWNGQNTLYPEGYYYIINNPNLTHNGFINCTDHTTGAGNMMVVNGDPTPNKVVWSSGNIAIVPNSYYSLSVWVESVNGGFPAVLIFNVNGVNAGVQFGPAGSGTAAGPTCQWQQAVATWYSGNLTTASFDIVNLNLAAGGNDFALDDISCKRMIDRDTDGDGVVDRLDLDSDNDGIFDLVEAGGTDINNDGIVDILTDTDRDGLADVIDNINSGSGSGEYTGGTALSDPDTDGDGLKNKVDLDSDGDGCYDVKEAGFIDGDNNGILGSSPVTVNAKGLVTSAVSYTKPANLDSGTGNLVPDYLQQVPFITTQPINSSICLPTNTIFSVTANNGGGTYLWQVSKDVGASWTDLAIGDIYSNFTTASLTLTAVTIAYDGYMYRVKLIHPAYACSPVISNAVTLRAFGGKPTLTGSITGNTTVCPSTSAFIYSIPANLQSESYVWSVPVGWSISSGAVTTAITTTSGATTGVVNILVSGVNSCGTGASISLPVTVAATVPSFTAPTGATACQSVDVTYTTQSGNSNYAWTIPGSTSGADYIITSGGSSTDNNIVIKWITLGSKTVSVQYNSGACLSTVASKILTVNSNAIITMQPVSPASICSGAGTSTISVTATGSSLTYQWQVSTDGGSTWSTLSNIAPYSNVTTSTITITIPLIGFNSYQYHCLVTGSCGAATSNAATLTVNSSAISSQSTATQTQCIGGSFLPITVTTPGTGLTYQWYSNATAINTGGTSLAAANGAQSANYTPQATTAGTLYYYCIVSGTCGSSTSAISGAFIVNPLPTITLGLIASVCEGVNSFSLPYTATGIPTIYSISVGAPAMPGFTVVTNAFLAVSPLSVSIPTTTLKGNYQFNIVVKNANGCISATNLFNLTVTPLPVTGPLYRKPNQ